VREVEPTYMVVVPRLLEAFEDGIRDGVTKAGPPQQGLLEGARSVGEARARELRDRGSVSAPLAAQWSQVQPVLSEVREAAGFGRLKAFASGGAPLPVATWEFFCSVGIPVLEGYGLTETAPVITFNRAAHCKPGTVGQPLKGVEVRIGADGEVLTRGPNVMRGYYNKPEETAQVLDAEGWLHTGDVGELDAEGFLRITDRIKDLLVLTNGKKVAPQPIESVLRGSPYISQVVLFGDQRPTVAALVVPDFERVAEWAREQGLELPGGNGAIAASPQVLQLIKGEVARLSGDLADFEKVRGIALLDADFTVEGGELTPTLKVKRRAVLRKYAEVMGTLLGDG